MNKNYFKNIMRDIKYTKGKVTSIAIMVGLAALVVVALTITGPSMRNTLNNSLKSYGHADMVITSTYGLDYEDELILKRDDDIDKMTLVKTADLQDGENLIRLKSYNKDIPKSVIVKGHMPEKPGEVALDIGFSKDKKIGDKIKFSYVDNAKTDEKSMKNLNYELVGFFKSSDHFMEDMKELSFTAKKELDGYGFVKEDDFAMDRYGEINISYKSIKNLDRTSEKYLDFVDKKQKKIEKSLANRPDEVLKDIKYDRNKDLDDAQKEIDDAKGEMSKAEKQLNDSRKKLNQAKEEYYENKEDFYRKTAAAKANLENSKDELNDGQDELRLARATYKNKEKLFEEEISSSENELKAIEEHLTSTQEEINQAKIKLDEGYERLDEEFKGPREELEKNLSQLQVAKNNLDTKKAEIDRLESLSKDQNDNNISSDESVESNSISREELEAMNAQFEAGYREYEEGLSKYKDEKNKLDNNYEKQRAKLDSLKDDLDKREENLNAGYAKLTKGKEELTENRISGQRKLRIAKNKIDQNEAHINKGRANYNQGVQKLNDKKVKGEKELSDAYKKILDGEEEYKTNFSNFQNEKKDSQSEIADSENEIIDAKDTLKRLADPEYNVENINDNQGISTYYRNSLNMDELTKVFPTFFYFVAMLVTLTTMKRFIEEQRTINGTLKALGYTSKQISQRFYIYGIIPTLIGSIIGAIIGRLVVANVIINAYSSGFGNLGIDYVNPLGYILFAVILSTLLVALTIHLSSKDTVKETPASLLLAKAPNPGKKILLERMTPIWKRLSFLQKITARNIFRYKSKMFMTLFGVGGCTALTFFGFAMIDSIKDTVNLQKDTISHYDVVAMVDENAKDKDLKSFNDKIKDFKSYPIRIDDIKVNSHDKERDIKVIVADTTGDFDKFISLYDLKRNPLSLANEKVLITEKIAKTLNIRPGDKIKIFYKGKDYNFTISKIVENYTGNYIYMDKDKFEKVTGEKFTANSTYILGNAENIIKNIEDEKALNAIIDSTVVYASIDVLMANLNLVIGVITLVSVMLALVVLYNLININVSERKRELATIKVLGFYPKEVTNYIFREIFILTILGIIVGYFLGIAMFRYVIAVVAPRDVLLSYRVHFTPFLLSGTITIAISTLLLLIVHKNLKKIDMAEAMSSGE